MVQQVKCQLNDNSGTAQIAQSILIGRSGSCCQTNLKALTGQNA